MSWTRSSYAWDAGRSTAIHDALGPLVADIRSLLGAGTGLVVYEPSFGPPLLLASDVTDDSADDPLLPNEPLRLPPAFPTAGSRCSPTWRSTRPCATES